MDTMTLTKAFASICGAFLTLLLGKWAAEGLYHVESHGEASYVIEVEESEDAGQTEEVDFATVLASASVEDGAKVFRKCSACHKLAEGENAAGPHLYGLVGRDKGSVDGYGYSDTLASMEGDWTPENLNGFLEKPSSYAPGTSMGFAGLKKVEERADFIAYLQSIN